MATAPENNSNFDDIKEIQELTGCYKNKAESGKKYGIPFLSRFIWPKNEVDHQNINIIRVVLHNKNSLLVTGENKQNILIKQVFEKETDFTIESGQVSLKSELFGSLAHTAGNVFIGAGHTSTTLGLDKDGHGKVTDKDTFLGTAFLVFPIAGHGNDQYRFTRVNELCK